MANGSRELTREITTYLACLAFVLAFLVATLTGGSSLTAVVRGAFAALAVLVFGRLLMRTLMSTLLDAIARDKVVEEAEGAE